MGARQDQTAAVGVELNTTGAAAHTAGVRMRLWFLRVVVCCAVASASTRSRHTREGYEGAFKPVSCARATRTSPSSPQHTPQGKPSTHLYTCRAQPQPRLFCFAHRLRGGRSALHGDHRQQRREQHDEALVKHWCGDAVVARHLRRLSRTQSRPVATPNAYPLSAATQRTVASGSAQRRPLRPRQARRPTGASCCPHRACAGAALRTLRSSAWERDWVDTFRREDEMGRRFGVREGRRGACRIH